MQIDKLVKNLIEYAMENALIEEYDRVYMTNMLGERLGLTSYTDEELSMNERLSIEETLSALCDYAVEKGIIELDSVVYRDLFDTSLMGVLTPKPSEVINKFFSLYKESPEKATDYFYKMCRDCDYIRTYRVIKDLKWKVDSEYGEIDITINLSKPEKDPKAIALAKSMPQSNYPKCLLCHENEGNRGSVSVPARQNLRQIPIKMDGKQWYLQYSPYVYYNEHCIALSSEHTPMKIDRSSFVKLLDFVDIFPHYFLGSNADLPIVGGSILSHDHMQGGRYTFAMERAPIEREIVFRGFEDIKAGIVKWPMSVIRIKGEDKARLVELADKILVAWRGYTDEEAFVFAETDNEPHNTITPIARRRGKDFELDLVLRNNITTEKHPLGLYHPHAEYHNIKKENIGLIEVMGLAVLPARLKTEMATLAEYAIAGKDIRENEALIKHAEWFDKFKNNYTFTKENADSILREEIGKTFVCVLEDAGVYKCTEDGRRAFMRFIDALNK
ncbi:MAG: UDP-glucose--hexose-1-phosphate uridylyltransferase [Clostridia bacterium]|nr:UDP-glucose--hexose-1-phosphate uridylyltransferase [Clostridia bacterium]